MQKKLSNKIAGKNPFDFQCAGISMLKFYYAIFNVEILLCNIFLKRHWIRNMLFGVPPPPQKKKRERDNYFKLSPLLTS